VALELLNTWCRARMRSGRATAWNCRTSPTEMLLEDIGRKRGAVLSRAHQPAKSR
jgi:hypothetical protein